MSSALIVTPLLDVSTSASASIVNTALSAESVIEIASLASMSLAAAVFLTVMLPVVAVRLIVEPSIPVNESTVSTSNPSASTNVTLSADVSTAKSSTSVSVSAMLTVSPA